MLQTIEKASEVLALFDRERPEWGVREVAEGLGLAKSSAHDLLTSLEQVGLLGKNGEGRYRLGWRLVMLSETLLATTELRREARPILDELAGRYLVRRQIIVDDTDLGDYPEEDRHYGPSGQVPSLRREVPHPKSGGVASGRVAFGGGRSGRGAGASRCGGEVIARFI